MRGKRSRFFIILLHIIALLNVANVILCVMFASDLHLEELYGPSFVGSIVAFGLALTIGIEITAWGLRKQKIWAWVIALCLCGLYALAILIPLGMISLWGGGHTIALFCKSGVIDCRLTLIQEAEELNRRVSQFYQQGRDTEALPLAQRALVITEKVFGPEHPDTAASLNNLALLYYETGTYTQAEPLYLRAVAIDDKILGPEHPSTVTSLENLTNLYRAMGAYSKAEPILQRILAFREKTDGLEHPNTATALNNLAEVYRNTADYAKAEELYRRALGIDEKVLGSKHPATAIALNNLAALYLATGAYTKAEPLIQRALAIHEKVSGPAHPATATALNNLAQIYDATGDFAKEEPLLQRAVAIFEKARGPAHPDTATALSNLGWFYLATGVSTKAEPLMQRALAIHEKVSGPAHPATAVALNNLAMVYRVTGAYPTAEPLMQRVLAIDEEAWGPAHPATATALDNLAGLYDDMEAYTTAEPLMQRALAIREKVSGPAHPDTALALNNLAAHYIDNGAYAKAKPLLQRAVAIYEKVRSKVHPHTATALDNLARVHANIGDYAKAKALYEQALDIYGNVLGPDHRVTAQSFKSLAGLAWQSGNPASALPLWVRAQAIDEKNMEGFLLSGSEARKQAYVQQFLKGSYANISWSLSTPSSQATALGLTSVLYIKGRVLDALSDSVARLRQSVKPEDRALFDELTAVARQHSTLIYQGLGRLSPDAYRVRVAELTTQQELLEAELSRRSAEFRRQVSPITLAGVQAVLPPHDTALVEWFRYKPFDPKAKNEKAKWGRPRYVAYVVRHEGEPAVVDAGDAEAIDKLVLDFRSALSNPVSAFVQELAKELSDKLLKPLRPYLTSTSRLLIAPDGPLNLVPFAALMDETGTYLATRAEISYLTSGRDLVRFDAAAVANGDPVIIADPAYGKSAPLVAQADDSVQPRRSVDLDRGGWTFTPLPGTAEEAAALRILLHLKQKQVLTQDKATESRLKQLHRPRMLHIATHGFFLRDYELPAAPLRVGGVAHDQPAVPLGENLLLRSGLALAGANLGRSGAQDDGILTAAEVAQMDLRGTQLVVLSACETGVGDVQNGEGVYGLRRALVLAGAETQVASLWKVADDATKDLMVDYYQRLLRGEGRSAALRAAQRTMLTSQTRAHPYYWAAFVPIGHWTPLTQTEYTGPGK
jgi:CHAT domain-containing protein/Tfp pilus assembly protein PilF